MRPDLVVLAEDTVEYGTAALIRAAHEQGAPSVIVPFTVATAEEEEAAEGIRPEEISPELLYTAEHPVFVPRANVSAPAPNGNGNGDANPNGREHDGSGKRRRGRRGGRRGRTGEDPNSSGGQ